MGTVNFGLYDFLYEEPRLKCHDSLSLYVLDPASLASLSRIAIFGVWLTKTEHFWHVTEKKPNKTPRTQQIPTTLQYSPAALCKPGELWLAQP